MAEQAMDCGRVMERLQDYLDRELTEGERASVEAHLAACGHCASIFRWEAGMLRVMKDGAQEGAPEGLLGRILGSLDD